MPNRRINPKIPRKVNRVFRTLIPRDPSQSITVEAQEQSIVQQNNDGDGFNSIGQIVSKGPSVCPSINMAIDNTGFTSSGTVHENVVENPSGDSPGTGRLRSPGNDSSSTSLPSQDFPTGFPLDPSYVSQIRGLRPQGAAMTVTNASSFYPVSVKPGLRYEAVSAIFNRQADYSFMLASVARKLAEDDEEVRIRNTTPTQRRQWYSTPVGPVCGPQHYVQVWLKAFTLGIPEMQLTMFLWEGESPIRGVEVYLGKTVFARLGDLGKTLTVRDFYGQDASPGTMNWAMAQSGNLEVSGKRVVVLQDDKKLMSN
ncbi:hypothetical protein N0V90_001511 [Kalmusia sp. IMI 367209]|nr:hypothetical protein N0V90_001511 [Kalmusia sp. IMI 367209]